MRVAYNRPDHFTKKAKAEGYAARSVFKLDEIEARWKVLPRRGVIVDLGCFPGSWSRWLQQRGHGVVGVDLQAPAFPGTWITASVMEIGPDALRAAAGEPIRALVSDMAPATTGAKFTDHCRQIELADRALTLAEAVVEPGGVFICKVFEGAEAEGFIGRVRAIFPNVRRFKPEATRDRSVEFFVVATGKRAGVAPGPTPG